MSTIGSSLPRQLVAQFQKLHASTGTPPWAWPFAPSIPLVGEQYEPGAGLLIYASAENLSWLYEKTVPARFTGPDAWDRYRAVYRAEGAGGFFPEVGIAPITNGSLLAAGLYVAQRLELPVSQEPRSFIESVALSNWCKFSIQGKPNRDYLGEPDKVQMSLPYVVAELQLLKPAVALVPRAIWKDSCLRGAMRRASHATCFVPVYQCNATVVNTHLAEYEDAGRTLEKSSRGSALEAWVREVRGIANQHAWRYIAFLSELLDQPPAGVC